MSDAVFDDLSDWLDEATAEKVAAVDLKHGKPAVSLRTRSGDCVVCPHCGERLTPSSVYTDKKGWKFCRPCFKKGHGAIRIDDEIKEAAAEKPFAFEYELPPEDIFILEKKANPNFGPRPRLVNATTPQAKRNKFWAAGLRGSAEPVEFNLDEYKLPAALLTPLLGAGIGYAASPGDEEGEPGGKYRGALKGLLSGAGTVGGAALGSHLAGGNAGAGIVGGAAGGIVSYLLSRGLIG